MKILRAFLFLYVLLFEKKSKDINQNESDNNSGSSNNWVTNQALHKPRNLSNSRLQRAANLAKETELRRILTPILVPRIAGTPENAAVRKHITDRLEKLPGWNIESHSFTDRAPYPFGEKNFTNIIATHNINAPRRLVLACHHDSKYMEENGRPREFIGATDSAVPCAMLIHLAENLHSYIESRSKDFPELTIQLLFFDGEEAFVRWSSFDSTYGSRKLAERMFSTKHHAVPVNSNLTEIDAIDVFVLLDLLGSQDPVFHDYFPETTKLYARMQRIETKLDSLNLLEAHTKNYFSGSTSNAKIQDDHIPFVNKGLKEILHLIPSPFPRVWHDFSDNEANLHYPTIMNLQKIMQVFVAEYMHLNV